MEKAVAPKMHTSSYEGKAAVQLLGGGQGKVSLVVSDQEGGWGDGSVAQCEQHKDLSWIPQHTCEKPGMVA